MGIRGLFSRKPGALTGAPPVRRLKTYSGQSGYVYQYFYEGQRPFRAGAEAGTEFVFRISHDRKTWHSTSVLTGDACIAAWEAQGRALSPTERYAVAKMALFQAFDERPAPDRMQEAVRLRLADIAGIIETLGL